MGDIALITVVGGITRPPDVKPMDNNPDRLTVKFSVASSYYQRGADQRPTAYFEATMFMNRSRWDRLSQFIYKGGKVLLSGQLRPRTGQDGKMWLNVEECDVEPMGPPQEGGQQGGHSQPGGYAPPQGGGLPSGWSSQVDPSSGRTYYVGPNGQTQWDPPTPPAPAPPPQGAPPAGPGGYQPPAGHGGYQAPGGYQPPAGYSPPNYGAPPAGPPPATPPGQAPGGYPGSPLS